MAQDHKSPESPPGGNRDSGQNHRLNPTAFIITFLVMMCMWIIFSGKFDSFHLSLGVISCLIVAYLSSDQLITDTTFRKIPVIWGGFILYFPWLLWQIVLANIHVLKLVYNPDMMQKINPQLIHFKSRLKVDMALVTFANSITLTPGTITVSLSVLGDFTVHAIDNPSAEPLPGEMEDRSGRIFGE